MKIANQLARFIAVSAAVTALCQQGAAQVDNQVPPGDRKPDVAVKVEALFEQPEQVPVNAVAPDLPQIPRANATFLVPADPAVAAAPAPWEGSSLNLIQSGVPIGADPAWQQISSGLERQIRQASEKLSKATEESKKAEAQKELRDLLNQYFDQDTLRREKELASIEERVKDLRGQLAKRSANKGGIIALQIKLVENEADGLGFFSNPGNSAGQLFEIYAPAGPPATVPPSAIYQVPANPPAAGGATYVPARRAPPQAAPEQRNGQARATAPARAAILEDLFPPAAAGGGGDPFK